MPKTKWPEFVPVLEARDFCRRVLSDSKGRHCLLGWVLDVFDDTKKNTVNDAIRKEISTKRGWIRNYDASITLYNDGESSKQTLANVFNAAMRKLGYTEITDA